MGPGRSSLYLGVDYLGMEHLSGVVQAVATWKMGNRARGAGLLAAEVLPAFGGKGVGIDPFFAGHWCMLINVQ